MHLLFLRVAAGRKAASATLFCISASLKKLPGTVLYLFLRLGQRDQ